MFFKKNNRKYGTNFIPPTNTPPPEDPPNQYGGDEFPILPSSEWMIATMELLKMCEEREKEPQKENKKDTTNYILVTRDEYLLNFIKRFGGNEEKAIESFNNISKGYNFVLAIDENHFYSVDYINKLLER